MSSINDVELFYESMRQDYGCFFSVAHPGRKYTFGNPTNVMIDVVQEAVDTVERGENYFAVVNIAPRHGKSDIFSKRAPAWILGKHPDWEMILAAYSASLAEELSGTARDCFNECCKSGVFNLSLSRDKHKRASWSPQDEIGVLNAMGLGGTINGRGAKIMIIDDYVKNRIEAESQTVRDAIWNSFTQDLMTRRDPTGHAVIIVATRWHVDDLCGRIIAAMKENPKFPKFKQIVMKSQNEDGSYLFPERFSKEFYEEARASVSEYGWNSLYQQDPKPREGTLLKIGNCKMIEVEDLPPGLNWRRGWDLASSEDERQKDDPDWTVGSLVAYDKPSGRIYYRDVVRFRHTALKRNEIMLSVAKADKVLGCNKTIIESTGQSKDTFIIMKAMLAGIQVVEKFTPQGTGDKVTRAASVLEAPMEAGNVYVVDGKWNDTWADEHLMFPNALHDDQVDSGVVAIYKDVVHGGENTVSELDVDGW